MGAQCGAGNDPTFAVNGSTYQVEAKPIGSGGVYWGNPIANPATGKADFGASSASSNGPPTSLGIDPANNFAQTVQSFGSVGAVDEVHNLLFAVPSAGGAQSQIVTDGPVRGLWYARSTSRSRRSRALPSIPFSAISTRATAKPTALKC